MAFQDEIAAETPGAVFRRGDLHIHSFGEFGSYDVKDSGMTPEAIVDMAVAENLQVIAIADHNIIGNVRRALTHASGKPILVVHAVELSTAQGHLLVYCPTIEALEAFFGKLAITPDHKVCHQTMPQCLKFADEVGGFGIAAHIDLESGFEQAHPKYDAFKQEILNSRNMLGLEVAQASNGHWFSHIDDHNDRRNCVAVRCEALGHEEETEIAKVMGSDAHSIGAFGRNAQGNKKLTRFKMDSLTFDSLRIALLDSAARVRLEDLIPRSIPHFVGMKLEGGFLNGQVLQFSKNLTCIIGGRGAGKSTMLESLRVSSGNSVSSSLVDSEVWPDSIMLIYEDEVGQRYELRRTKLNDDIINLTAPDGPTYLAIESYGQGETAETIQHCDRDPSILLRFLDDFINLEGLPEQDEALCREFLENQSDIERLHMETSRIPEIEKAKKIADQQLETLKGQNAGKVVELEQKLATERHFRTQLTTNLSDLLKGINASLSNDTLTELIAELDSSTLAVGKDQCDEVKKLITELSGRIGTLSTDLKKQVQEYTDKIVAQLKLWTHKEQETQNKIEEIRRDLEKQHIKLDIAFIRKVTKDSTDYAQKLIELKKLVPLKEAAWKRRRELFAERKRIRSRIHGIRQAFATQMNKNLAATVVDYRVSIKFHEAVLSPELEDIVKTAMEWRTSQVPKAKLIAERLSPLALFEALQKNNTAPFEELKDADGHKVFSGAEATQVLGVLNQWKTSTQIQRCAFEDRPEIKVTKVVTRPDGTKAYLMRDFSQLSLGQQQSILLSVMLFSKSAVPLIIDQPEDNLDSEFIYKTLVRSLRNIKEHRQVIIVTHNANIAVLGDAELIVPLRGASELAVIRDRGSIDTPATKEIVCTILEGSKKAFIRRKDVYGF